MWMIVSLSLIYTFQFTVNSSLNHLNSKIRVYNLTGFGIFNGLSVFITSYKSHILHLFEDNILDERLAGYTAGIQQI